MTGPIHTPQALAEFQNGEERMVFARHKTAPPDAPPYFLEDGTARDKALKAWVREHLECLMPECPNRDLSAVSRSENSGRRDGFTHRKGAGKHAPEGLFHQQGKALIQSWVSSAYPDATVTLELATATRERIADVMVEWPTGQRIAIEIQYAALTVEAWLTRHQSYLDQGITPVWLLGHHGAQMKAARDPYSADWDEAAGQVQLSLLQQKIAEHNAAVLWMNPIDRSIATPWTVERANPQAPVHTVYCTPTTNRAFLTVDALDTCELDPTRGLITPTMREIEEAERQRREEEQRRIEEANRLRAEQEAEAAYYEELRRQQLEVWEASPLSAVFARRWQRTPDLLGLLPEDDLDQSGVWAYPTHWRGVIYEELIHPFTLGPEPTLEDQLLTGALLPPRDDPHFTLDDIRVAFAAHDIRTHKDRPEKTGRLVRAFLHRLHARQVLVALPGSDGRPRAFAATGKTLGQAEAEHQREQVEREDALARRRAAIEAQRQAREEAQQRAAEQRRARAARHAEAWDTEEPPSDPERQAARSQCNRCGRPLPTWQQGGYHTSGCP